MALRKAAVGFALASLATLAPNLGHTAPGVRYLGPDDLTSQVCPTNPGSRLFQLGEHRIRVSFADLKRVKTVAGPSEAGKCEDALPIDDLLVSTPDGFRSHLTYKGAKISADDAERIRETVIGFSNRASCEIRETVKICRMRGNPQAPVTTFVFVTDPAQKLSSGAPAYIRCTAMTGGDICKIQDLSRQGFQYEAAVAYSDKAETIARYHQLALTKWDRFRQAAER